MKRLFSALLVLGFMLGNVPVVRAQEYAETAKSLSSVITPAEARAAFAVMSEQKDIAFEYLTDGCYARAHLMSQRLMDMDICSLKVWAFANPDPLRVRTKHGTIDWQWHVAPAVRVKTRTGVKNVVIDPSLFKGPVTVATWCKAMETKGSHLFVTITRLGEPPLMPSGKRAKGSGYRPGPDPVNIDAHAEAVMKKYKALARTGHFVAAYEVEEEDPF